MLYIANANKIKSIPKTAKELSNIDLKKRTIKIMYENKKTELLLGKTFMLFKKIYKYLKYIKKIDSNPKIPAEEYA